MLVQRLLTEGDPAYEEEIFFTTRRGTRLLNMSDFRDTSRSDSWDYSAFVRTYALYMDERLEYRMEGKRRKRNACTYSYEEKEEEDNASVTSPSGHAAVDDLNIDEILSKVLHLQRLLERFLATKPAGVFLQRCSFSSHISCMLDNNITELGGVFLDFIGLQY